MKTLDLKRIRTLAGLKPAELAPELFADHKHPYRALNYVESGKKFLDSQQISKLSDILNIPIGLLFDDAAWRMGRPAGAVRGVLLFETYDYIAELDTATMTTTVTRNGITIFDGVKHSGVVELSEYLSEITALIIKHNRK